MWIETLSRNVQVDSGMREWIERRVHFALGRFVTRIGRVGFFFENVCIPHCGIRTCCRLRITLIPDWDVEVEDVDSTIEAVTAKAIERAVWAVTRAAVRQQRDRAESEAPTDHHSTPPLNRSGEAFQI